MKPHFENRAKTDKLKIADSFRAEKMLKTDFELTSLKIFLEASDDCNMTSAAKRLGLSQPAVSACITRLETQIGASLFDRSYRPILLTPAGRVLRRRALDILQNVHNLATEVQAAQSGVRLDLRLASSDNISRCCIPFFLHKILPNIHTLSSFTGHTPFVCDLLSQEKVDIALATNPLYSDKNIQSVPLFQEEFLLVMPPDISCQGEAMLDMQELAKSLPFIGFNRTSQDAVETERILRLHGVAGPKRIISSTDIMTLSLVARGLGWSILPVLGIWSESEYLNSVRIVRLRNCPVLRHAFLMYLDPLYQTIAEKIALELKAALGNQVLPLMRSRMLVLAQSFTIL